MMGAVADLPAGDARRPAGFFEKGNGLDTVAREATVEVRPLDPWERVRAAAQIASRSTDKADLEELLEAVFGPPGMHMPRRLLAKDWKYLRLQWRTTHRTRPTLENRVAYERSAVPVARAAVQEMDYIRARRLRERHAAGESLGALAQEYGIAASTARHIAAGRLWKGSVHGTA